MVRFMSAVSYLRRQVKKNHVVPTIQIHVESHWLTEDSLDDRVAWRRGSDFSLMEEQTIRFQFQMVNTDLYSLRVQ
jgi:hypothetical protein